MSKQQIIKISRENFNLRGENRYNLALEINTECPTKIDKFMFAVVMTSAIDRVQVCIQTSNGSVNNGFKNVASVIVRNMRMMGESLELLDINALVQGRHKFAHDDYNDLDELWENYAEYLDIIKLILGNTNSFLDSRYKEVITRFQDV